MPKLIIHIGLGPFWLYELRCLHRKVAGGLLVFRQEIVLGKVPSRIHRMPMMAKGRFQHGFH